MRNREGIVECLAFIFDIICGEQRTEKIIITENYPRLHLTNYSCIMLLISRFWLPPLRSNNSAVLSFPRDSLAAIPLTNSFFFYYIAKFTGHCHKPPCEGHLFSSVSRRRLHACLRLPMLRVPLPPRDMIPPVQHNPAVLAHVSA